MELRNINEHWTNILHQKNDYIFFNWLKFIDNSKAENVYFHVLIILCLRDEVKKSDFIHILNQLKVKPYFRTKNEGTEQKLRNKNDKLLTSVWKDLSENGIIKTKKKKGSNAEFVSLSETFMLKYCGGYWPKAVQIKEKSKVYSSKIQINEECKKTVDYFIKIVYPLLFPEFFKNHKEKSKDLVINEIFFNHFLAAQFILNKEIISERFLGRMAEDYMDIKNPDNITFILREIANKVQEAREKEQKAKEQEKKTPVLQTKISMFELTLDFFSKIPKEKKKNQFLSLEENYFSRLIKGTEEILFSKLFKHCSDVNVRGRKENLSFVEWSSLMSTHMNGKNFLPHFKKTNFEIFVDLINLIDDGDLGLSEGYRPFIFKTLNNMRLSAKNLMIWDESYNLEAMKFYKKLYSKEFIKQNAFIFKQLNNKQRIKTTDSLKDKKKI
jgi:hypothetical protein